MKRNVTAALALVAVLGTGSVLACDGAPAATDASVATPSKVASAAPGPTVASKRAAPQKLASSSHAREWFTCLGYECARPVVAACEGKDCSEQPITR